MKKAAFLGAAVFCMLAFTAQAAEENPTPPAGQTETSQATPPTTGQVTPPAEDKKPEQPSTPGDGTTQPEPKDDEVVCKRVETASGSRIGTKRVCLTVREWRDYKEEK